MHDDVRDLVDRFWAYRHEVDDQTPLWDSQLDQVERWVTTSMEHTEEVRRRMLAFAREAAELLERRALDARDRATVRTLADAAQLDAASVDVTVELVLPHPDMGLHSYLFWAVNNFPLRTAEHGERWLDKLARFPATVDELRARLVTAAQSERVPIASHTARAIELLDQHLASEVADDPLLQQPAPTELDEAATDAWRSRVADAVRDHVRPALARLRETLQEETLVAGRHDEDCGLLHLPHGRELYAALVEGYTAPGTTPEQVHEVGLAQVERLAEEYRELGGRAFGTTDLAEVFARLRDPALHFTTAEEVVAAATAHHRRAEELAPAWFLRTPAAPCEIRAVEHGSLAFYSRPAEDGSRPGVFFFRTSDPTVWGPNLASTVFHEGIPGHHFQLALAMEDPELHPMHRDLFLSAFGEGWALYTERLSEEMGLFTNDVDRLGMLANDSLRACRLVVDTGMHALGWTRQRAIDFMVDNSPLSLVEITGEVDRYIGWPGQATSYMMGRLEIERLRAEAEAALGDGFDLRRFHDVLLGRGMLSLTALRTVVEDWVAEGSRAPG